MFAVNVITSATQVDGSHSILGNFMKDDILLISSYLEYILSITFDESNVAVLFNRQVLKFNYFWKWGRGQRAEGRGANSSISVFSARPSLDNFA